MFQYSSMRYRVDLMRLRGYGASFYLFEIPGNPRFKTFVSRGYCAPHQSRKDKPGETGPVPQRAVAAVQNLTELGRQWGQNTMRTASATANYWWEKYEEFVGLNEVRDAQMKVTEAEKAFMVARGMVREAHESLEALQGRLKEVRDRLDRVSREEAHYLELATVEHKLLQEERRLRTAYENAEGAERERFALFSAAVRESHEKERTRAERTKNWSVIGSVLGALIGVMGSTYVNRVRLQELKSLLLEAQKGPVSLQEAIKVQASLHKSQQLELRGLIDSLSGILQGRRTEEDRAAKAEPVPAPNPVVHSISPSAFESALKELQLSTQRAHVLMEGFQPHLSQLEQIMCKVESELQAFRVLIEASRSVDKAVVSAQDAQVFVCDTEGVMHGLAQTERRLEEQINKNTLYSTVLTYTAFAITVPLLYVIFRGS
ncbi:hypothetical protein JZ751_021154 [Albula glossodonta]|uniref:Coiled-coil domain-containing protein 51 n=1 Tax=Albula glossodonta TaxID=121402 RepID=A0A8T2NK29_9TELE|nr:hypothetical protein JZ751_021154 [Albula glossodonta]